MQNYALDMKMVMIRAPVDVTSILTLPLYIFKPKILEMSYTMGGGLVVPGKLEGEGDCPFLQFHSLLVMAYTKKIQLWPYILSGLTKRLLRDPYKNIVISTCALI